MRPKPRAFIFDIDGTLLDSNELHVDAWDRAFRHFGKQFSRDALRAQIGKGSDQYLPEFLTPEEIERFGKELDHYRSQLFRKEYLPRVRPFPKVRELFQRIRDDDKRIMLASSGKEEDTKYYIEDLLKIDDLIEGYTCADDADRSKPAPDIFTAALDKLGKVSPGDAITVGDTRFDIEAAAKAAMATIGLLCGGTAENVLRDTGAIAIYRDPADMFADYDRLTDYGSAEQGARRTDHGKPRKKLKFRARSTDALRCSRGRRPRLLQLDIANCDIKFVPW